jgi:hypothetical protein
VTLTFDTSAVPSANIVVGNKINTTPLVDGVDEGSEVWGPKRSTSELEQQSFAENYIDGCKIRCAYNDYTIYFQVTWTEEQQAGFRVKKDTLHLPWKYNQVIIYNDDGEVTDTANKFQLEYTFEDRVALMFPPDKPKQFWNDFGCLTACHLGDGEPDYMRSTSGSDLIDVWQWGSARSQGTGIGLDRCLTNMPNNGFIYDGGVSPLYENIRIFSYTAGVAPNEYTVVDSAPVHMHVYHEDDQDFVAEDPMLEYFVVPYDSTLSWDHGAVLPTWILRPPSLGNDLIMCEGRYSNGTWTVEFARTRKTKDVYDANF